MGSSLHEAADMLLQYLEAKTELDGGLEDDLSLAVTRCLGRQACHVSFYLSSNGLT